jgi:hypothetical protein
MDRSALVRSHVETLLETVTGKPQVKPDADGDYAVRFQNAVYFVRILGTEHPVVQVFAVAVDGADPRPELYQVLNDLNARLTFARTFAADRKVVIASELLGESLDADELGSACAAVARAADHFGPLLANQFGGELPFEHQKGSDYQPPADAPGTGGYL